MISITLTEDDWEAVNDALDRVGYHSIASEIERQATENAERVAQHLATQEGTERYFARRIREEGKG